MELLVAREGKHRIPRSQPGPPRRFRFPRDGTVSLTPSFARPYNAPVPTRSPGRFGGRHDTVRIFWIDPLNTDPHFLNLMSIVLQEHGHDVHVRSIARHAFPPPPGVHWTPFLKLARRPFTLKHRKRTALRLLAGYPFHWLRAIRHAQALRAKAVLVTANLTLPGVDAWAMRVLARRGIASVALVHRPFRTDPTRSRPRLGWFASARGRGAAASPARSGPGRSYRAAAKILVMSDYAREQAQRLCGLPDHRFSKFPHPHFQPVLDRHCTNRELAGRLSQWAGGAPVVGFLSNHRAEQGLDDLLSALGVLDARHARWRLLLVSSSVSKAHPAEVEERLARLGFRERCRSLWAPYSQADLKACLAATSLVVTPYRFATQSGVQALAAGAGIPVVTTDAGGLPEAVRPGVNGEVAPVGDPERLAEAILRVIGRLEHYRSGARACRDALHCPRQAADAVVDTLSAAAEPGTPREGTDGRRPVPIPPSRSRANRTR